MEGYTAGLSVTVFHILFHWVATVRLRYDHSLPFPFTLITLAARNVA